LRSFEFAEVNGFIREGSHLSLLTNISPTAWQILIKLDLFRLLIFLLWMIAGSSKFEDVGVWTGALNVADLDWQVYSILFCLKWSKKGINVLSIVGRKSPLRILYFEDSEIVVALVKGLQSGCIDLVLELGDTEVFDLNRISNCPFKTYWGRRQIVDVFEQTQISPSVERFALEVNYQRLAVRNLQERLQVVSFHFLGVVINVELHLFSWLELSESWVNVEDLVVEDVFLEGLFGRWLSRIGPRFHLDFGVVWQFELPIRLDTSDILDCQSDLPGFGPVLDWDFAEVPVEDCQVPDEFI